MALLAAISLGAAPRAGATAQEQAWSWFSECGGPRMAIEVRFEEDLVFKASTDLCRASGTREGGKGEEKALVFPFKPGHDIVWEGYREGDNRTKAGRLLEGNIWQAGADLDAIILGLSFADSTKIYMNTLHVAHPFKRSQSELVKGLTVVTYPLAKRTARAR